MSFRNKIVQALSWKVRSLGSAKTMDFISSVYASLSRRERLIPYKSPRILANVRLSAALPKRDRAARCITAGALARMLKDGVSSGRARG